MEMARARVYGLLGSKRHDAAPGRDLSADEFYSLLQRRIEHETKKDKPHLPG